MSKIKLPWRRFGNETPVESKEGWEEVLCFFKGASIPAAYGFKCGEYPYWQTYSGEERYKRPASPGDRWIYLSEIANPFEDEEHEFT